MKVLLISHNPITTYQSMGKTFLSLFSAFPKDELCQLYIYPSLPDVDICSSYFRITDKNVFESYLHFGKVHGTEISSSQIDINSHKFYENDSEEKFLNTKKTPLKTILRDIMWRFSRWNNKQFGDWLQKQRPTCIFLAPGESKFIYNVALKISHQYSIPLATYICDEFYFVKQPEEFWPKIQFLLLKRKIEKLMSETKLLVTISDELNKAYSSRFHRRAVTIYTGSTRSMIPKETEFPSEIKGFYYFGNLAYGRFESLEKIAKAIELSNQELNKKFRLFIYTRTLSKEQEQSINKSNVMDYVGYVTGKDFEKEYKKADVLIHIESFNVEDIDRVKNSISTKIADALSSGKPLLAFGPESIASMKYLSNEKAACTVTKESDLPDKVKALLDKDYRMEIAKNALATARKNHSSVSNSKALYEELKGISL